MHEKVATGENGVISSAEVETTDLN